jgi:hypothetical protein
MATPFFTLTQNALADHRSYLRYARSMYGSRIYIPTEEDATHAFDEYQEAARQRQSQGKLLPGEVCEEIGGKMEVRGQLAVMAINGSLSNLMFERNPEREFYVEESFPLTWMYPRLTPHGLILKINREALSELSRDVVQRDYEYWARYIGPMIGDWLEHQTSLSEIVAFVEKTYVHGDLDGFTGDPRYVKNHVPQKSFSKLRSAIAGLYAWRAQNSKSTTEKEHMLEEADFAFRQAFALYPASPEVVFRYVGLLVRQKRLDDAISMTEGAVKVEQETKPSSEVPAHIQKDFSHKPMIESRRNPPRLHTQLGSLLEQLTKMKNK